MDTNKFRDDFLFAMAIEDVDSQTMDWLTKQDFYRELRKELSFRRRGGSIFNKGRT